MGNMGNRQRTGGILRRQGNSHAGGRRTTRTHRQQDEEMASTVGRKRIVWHNHLHHPLKSASNEEEATNAILFFIGTSTFL
jgi:hypothetical protein